MFCARNAGHQKRNSWYAPGNGGVLRANAKNGTPKAKFVLRAEGWTPKVKSYAMLRGTAAESETPKTKPVLFIRERRCFRAEKRTRTTKAVLCLGEWRCFSHKKWDTRSEFCTMPQGKAIDYGQTAGRQKQNSMHHGAAMFPRGWRDAKRKTCAMIQGTATFSRGKLDAKTKTCAMLHGKAMYKRGKPGTKSETRGMQYGTAMLKRNLAMHQGTAMFSRGKRDTKSETLCYALGNGDVFVRKAGHQKQNLCHASGNGCFRAEKRTRTTKAVPCLGKWRCFSGQTPDTKCETLCHASGNGNVFARTAGHQKQNSRYASRDGDALRVENQTPKAKFVLCFTEWQCQKRNSCHASGYGDVFRAGSGTSPSSTPVRYFREARGLASSGLFEQRVLPLGQLIASTSFLPTNTQTVLCQELVASCL